MSTKSHLEEIGLTYNQHFYRAMSIGWILFSGGIKCFVHAVLPDVWTEAYTDTMFILHYYGYKPLSELKDEDIKDD